MKSPKNRAGRPPHMPTIEDRISVERMMACGDPLETIARALRIDKCTLQKHYGYEIQHGAANQRRLIVDLIFKGAQAGNASLQRRLEEITRLGLDDLGEEKPAKLPNIGKKAIVRDAAMKAGTQSEWGDDLKPPPDLLPN